jgi:glycosyltransferase involved in cell wall biosynthesis
MKILQVVPVFSDSFGGPVTVVRSLSKELAKKHDVTVYTTTALDSKHDFESCEEDVDGYHTVYFERTLKPLCYSGLFGQLNLSYGMMQSVKNNLQNFDVVHVHSWQQFPDVLVHYYATKYSVPYVLQVHGSLPNIMAKHGMKQMFNVLFGGPLLSDASNVIAITDIEANQYQNAEVPKNKISIIPNGLDMSKYSSLPPKGNFRKKHNIGVNQKIVLFLGRIHRIKGIENLVEAFAKTNEKINDSLLVIVGPDDGYLAEIKSLINTLKINDKVIFVGPLYGNDKLEAFLDADVYVLPSKYEIFGMTILESMACGTPVIVSENCGLANYLRDKAGLVAENNTVSIQTALFELLSNKIKLEQFRQNCKILIKNFDMHHLVSMYEMVYIEAINKGHIVNDRISA